MIIVSMRLASIIIIYTLSITLITAVLIVKIRRRKKKYIHFKEEKINLFVWKYTEQRNDDDLLNELFSENQRLESEVKYLKKDNTMWSVAFVLSILIVVIQDKIKKKLNKKTAP